MERITNNLSKSFCKYNLKKYQLSSSTSDDAEEWAVRDFGPTFIRADAPSSSGDSVRFCWFGAVTTYWRRSDDSPILIWSNLRPTFFPHVEIPENKEQEHSGQFSSTIFQAFMAHSIWHKYTKEENSYQLLDRDKF